MTDAELEEAKRLCESLTDGDWYASEHGPNNPNWFVGGVSGGTKSHMTEGDARFIAASRQLVPRLIAALESARRERDEARVQLDCASAGCGTDERYACRRCCRIMLANYAANHGTRCDAEHERLLAALESARRERDEYVSYIQEMDRRIGEWNKLGVVDVPTLVAERNTLTIKLQLAETREKQATEACTALTLENQRLRDAQKIADVLDEDMGELLEQSEEDTVSLAIAERTIADLTAERDAARTEAEQLRAERDAAVRAGTWKPSEVWRVEVEDETAEAIAAWLDRNAWALDYPLRSTLTEAAEQIRAGAWRTTKGDASK